MASDPRDEVRWLAFGITNFIRPKFILRDVEIAIAKRIESGVDGGKWPSNFPAIAAAAIDAARTPGVHSAGAIATHHDPAKVTAGLEQTVRDLAAKVGTPTSGGLSSYMELVDPDGPCEHGEMRGPGYCPMCRNGVDTDEDELPTAIDVAKVSLAVLSRIAHLLPVDCVVDLTDSRGPDA